MIAVAALEEEEARRDAEVTRVRSAVSEVFVVGGEASFLVLAGDVYRAIAGELDEPIVRPALRALVGAVVSGMGAVRIRVGGRPCFAAVRRREIPVAQARLASKALRARLIRDPRRRTGATGVTGATVLDALLQSEGMPPELEMIRRGKFVQDVTPGVQAEIYSGEHDDVTDLLAEVEEERKLLRLRSEGFSLRAIGIRMGLDKMAVSRVLARIKRRRKRDIPALDE